MAVISCINKKHDGVSSIFYTGALEDQHSTVYSAFNQDDVEILEAFCVEASVIIHRFLTDAILEHVPDSDRDDVRSMLEAYNHPIKMKRSDSVSTATKTTSLILDPSASEFATVSVDVNSILGKIKWPLSQIKVDINELRTLQFNVWQYTADDLVVFTYYIFESSGLMEEFNIPQDIFKNFVLCVRSKYRENPFHNWYHGFSVLHFSYLFLHMSETSVLNRLGIPIYFIVFKTVEILALFIASLCHDIGMLFETSNLMYL